jgi:hypothetical protein
MSESTSISVVTPHTGMDSDFTEKKKSITFPLVSAPSFKDENKIVRKELDMRLTAYLPAVVRRYLEQQESPKVPDTHETTVVTMFADVSGFTAMTESLAARGPVGAEYLGKHLNSYFEQLLRLVSSAGKFLSSL